jgi:hypothetical protein
LLINNGLAGILVPLSATLAIGRSIEPMGLFAITPLWGIAAGFIALRGYIAGALAGVGFYAVQTISFFSPSFNFNFKSGLSLAVVFVLPQGVVVINWAALLLAILCCVVVLSKNPEHRNLHTDA